MGLQTPAWLNYLVAYLTAVALIYGGFNATERLLRPETLARIGQRIGGTRAQGSIFGRDWTAGFLEFFDTLFVPTARRSWGVPLPGFWRSAAFSIAFVIGLANLFYFLLPNVLPAPYLLILFILMLNLVPDFISILETRLVLGFMRRARFPYIWLATDAAITFLLPLCFLMALKPALEHMTYETPHYKYPFTNTIIDIPDDVKSYIDMITWAPRPPMVMPVSLVIPEKELIMNRVSDQDLFTPYDLTYGLNIFIYSTFLTSFWVWLYALADLLVRGVHRINVFRRFLERHTLLERHPVSIMGYLLIALTTFSIVIYAGFSQLLASQG